jgi:hypothetical protein
VKINVETKLGQAVYRFEIEEKSDIEALHKAAVLGNPPLLCDECGNDKVDQFKLQSNKDAEGNTYVNVECNICTAKAKLGLYKSGGFFFHKYAKYVKKIA